MVFPFRKTLLSLVHLRVVSRRSVCGCVVYSTGQQRQHREADHYGHLRANTYLLLHQRGSSLSYQEAPRLARALQTPEDRDAGGLECGLLSERLT